jgi:hypothetical protein
VQVASTEKALPSDDAFVWALAAVPENHRAALELMMMTGLSPHEAERLQVRDFHPTVAGVGVSIGVGQRPDFRVKTPSRKRWIPLNPRARKLWVTARATFKQDDVARAVKGVTAAGLQVARVIVVDGRIEVIVGDPDSVGPQPRRTHWTACMARKPKRDKYTSPVVRSARARALQVPPQRRRLLPAAPRAPGLSPELTPTNWRSVARRRRRGPRARFGQSMRCPALLPQHQIQAGRRRLARDPPARAGGLRNEFGDDLVSDFRPKDIDAILAAKLEKQKVGKRTVGGTSAALRLREQLDLLFKFASGRNGSATNPVEHAEEVEHKGARLLSVDRRGHRRPSARTGRWDPSHGSQWSSCCGPAPGEGTRTVPRRPRTAASSSRRQDGQGAERAGRAMLQAAIEAMPSVGITTLLVTDYGSRSARRVRQLVQGQVPEGRTARSARCTVFGRRSLAVPPTGRFRSSS